MPAGIGDLKVVASGTGSNLLGGSITSGFPSITSQTTTYAATKTITGVTINDAYGNPEGIGSMFWDVSASNLGWRPAGGTTYYGAVIGAAGQYVIGSSSGYLLVTTTSMPVADAFDNVNVANAFANVFPAVSAGQSLLGRDDYRCVYIRNSHASATAVNIRLWILNNTPGADNIQIAIDPQGKGNTLNITTGGGINPPSGGGSVAFSNPTSAGAALQLPGSGSAKDLAAGEYFAVWLWRHVPPETRGTVISNNCTLAIALDAV